MEKEATIFSEDGGKTLIYSPARIFVRTPAFYAARHRSETTGARDGI
jgi:hypothetical protein